jgi:hypothetical protein
MGWDFTATPYDEAGWAEFAATVARGPDAIRARLEQGVPAADRSRHALADLGDGDLGAWRAILFLELAARGRGVFLGRSRTIGDLADEADAPLAAELRPIARTSEPLLQLFEGEDAEHIRHRWTPAFVERIATHAEHSGVPPLTEDEVDGLMACSRRDRPSRGDDERIRALGWSEDRIAEVLRKPMLLHLALGRCRGAAAAGHGLVWSHDDLGPTLRKRPTDPPADDPTLPEIPEDEG